MKGKLVFGAASLVLSLSTIHSAKAVVAEEVELQGNRHLEVEPLMMEGQIYDSQEPHVLENDDSASKVRSGTIQTGWQSVNGKWYYYKNGIKATGWQSINGSWYYLNGSGVMLTGWQSINGKWYYLNTSGAMLTGWQSINGSWYYLDGSGAMRTGWQFINSKWYYLNASGAMQTDWIKLNNKWYYLNTSGAMLTGKQTINGKVYFFDSSGAWTKGQVVKYVNYIQTLEGMLTKQFSLNPPPQTDRARSSSLQVESLRLDGMNHEGVVTGPTDHVYSELEEEYNVNARSMWRNATKAEARPFINPKTYAEGSVEFNQFLVLSESAGTSVVDLNNHVLKGKGILAGRGKSFHDASAAHKINEVYLIAHAFLESGNGTSKLATGVDVGLNKAGQPELLTTSNKNQLTNVQKVYNMFGIGAYDSCALDCGAKKAYVEKWNTPEKAIVGGAKFVSQSYINHATHKQDTLYKMRWNPANPGVHQYATDMEWATKQARIQTKIMNQVYDALDAYTLYYEVPVYK